MRVGALALVVSVIAAAAAAAAIGACSDFSSDEVATTGDAALDTSVPSDSGADAATSDAGDALAPTPGKIGCFGLVCDKANNSERCCYDTDAGAPSCARDCAYPLTNIACDDQADCALGEACCVGIGPSCQAKANCMTDRLCHQDADCATGASCLSVLCRGTLIGVCYPAGFFLKTFCGLK